MYVVRHTKTCPDHLKGSVLALGNFDGVHRGHQTILKAVKEKAEALDAPAAIMTFEPHPLALLKPEAAPSILTPLRQKLGLFLSLGMDMIVVQRFSRVFSELSGEEFVRKVLFQELAVQHLVIGHDFIFGHKRSGNAELLKRLAAEEGIGFTQLAAQGEEDTVFSSTKIRAHLAAGNVEVAAKLLGRPYAIQGRVIKGAGQAGQALGFPTANIRLKRSCTVPYGVYAVSVAIEGESQCYQGVANIGVKPTFGLAEPLLEVHLFDVNRDIYGKHIEVNLLTFLRLERKFETIEALKAQIARDADAARTYNIKS
jgi:riboflavin kinase/FMN adenylyltransferase